MEHSPMRRAGAIPSALLAANMLITPSAAMMDNVPEPPKATSLPTAIPTIPEVGCWEVPSPRSPELHEADKAPLPLLGNNDYIDGKEFSDSVRVGVIRNGVLQLEKPAALTQEYVDAIEDAASVPYVSCVLKKHVKEGRVQVSEKGSDNGYYHTNPDSPDEYDTLNLIFSKSGDPEADAIATTGSVIPLVVHEGTHAMYDEWTDETRDDPKGEAIKDRLDSLLVQELQVVAESFRAQNEEVLLDTLSNLQDEYTANKAPHTAKAIGSMISAVGTSGGLREVVADCEFFEECESNSVRSMIYDLSQANEVSIYSMTKETNKVDTAPLEGLNRKYLEHLESRFDGSDESTILKEYMKSGGHPYDNASELVASTITSDLCNPEGAIASINALPQAQREIVIEQRKAMVELFTRYNPELLPYINTPQVLEQLS